MVNPISQFISSRVSPLSPRDRRILFLAMPLILLLIVAVAGRTLVQQQDRAEARLNRSLEDIAWLQSQSAFVPQQGRRCPVASWNSKRINALAGRYSLTLGSMPVIEGSRLQLAVASAPGNQVVEFIAVLECQGATLTDFELETLDASGAVRGSLVALLP